MKRKGRWGLWRFQVPETTALAGRGEPGKLGRQQQGEEEVATNTITKHNKLQASLDSWQLHTSCLLSPPNRMTRCHHYLHFGDKEAKIQRSLKSLTNMIQLVKSGVGWNHKDHLEPPLADYISEGFWMSKKWDKLHFRNIPWYPLKSRNYIDTSNDAQQERMPSWRDPQLTLWQ